MKKQLAVIVLAAMAATSASAMSCGAGESKVVVKQDTVGAISVRAFEDINFESAESVQSALTGHTARKVAGGTVACMVNGEGGFFDYAVQLKSEPLDLWVQKDTVVDAQ